MALRDNAERDWDLRGRRVHNPRHAVEDDDVVRLDDLRAAIAGIPVSSYTFTDGLTLDIDGHTVRGDYITGKAGGNTWNGGLNPGDGLTVNASKNAPQGPMRFNAAGWGFNANAVLPTMVDFDLTQTYAQIDSDTDPIDFFKIRGSTVTFTTDANVVATRMSWVFIGAPTFDGSAFGDDVDSPAIATLWVDGPPIQAGWDDKADAFAIYIAAGDMRVAANNWVGGNFYLNGTGNQIIDKVTTGDLYVYNGNGQLLLTTLFGSPTITIAPGSGALGLNVAPAAAQNRFQAHLNWSVASATSATLNAFYVDPSTIAISGSTPITTAGGFNLTTFSAPTYNGTVTVNNAATVAITGPPTGTATITNPYSLNVQSGTTRLAGSLIVGTLTGILKATSGVVSTGTLTGADIGGFTPGSIPFAGAGGTLTENNTSFFWDNTNKRIGIGSGAPALPIDINLSGVNWHIRLGSGAGTSYDIGRNTTDGMLYFSGNQSGFSGYVFSGVVGGTRMAISDGGVVTIPGLGGGSAAILKSSTAGVLQRASGGTDYENPLTFSTPGNTRSGNNITADYITGLSGGATWTAGTASGDPLLIRASSNAQPGVMTLKASQIVHTLVPGTLVSATGLALDAFSIPSSTVTISGGTAVSPSTGFNYVTIGRPTYTGTATVGSGATLAILGEPQGTATPVNHYALWVQQGSTGFDGVVRVQSLNGLVKASSGVLGVGTGGTDFEFPLTFSSPGNTRAANNVTADYITGHTGNQTWIGSTDNGGTLKIQSSSGTRGALTLDGSSISINGDINSPSSALRLQTGAGVTAVYIDTSQHVGIGGVAPGATSIFDVALTQTVASGTSAVLDAFLVRGSTITVSGGTPITTAAGFNYVTFGRPTYNGTASISNGATVTILGEPQGTDVPINHYALWVQQGSTFFGGVVQVQSLNGIIKGSSGVLGVATGGTDFEFPLAFSTGLHRATNTITADLSTGVSGGQTATGGTASGNSLTLRSNTSNNGKILLGSTTYGFDESLGQFFFGTSSPISSSLAHFNKSQDAYTESFLTNANAGTSAGVRMIAGLDPTSDLTKNVSLSMLGTGRSTAGLFGPQVGLLEHNPSVTANFLISTLGAADIVFTNGGSRTERMRILNNGHVQVGSGAFDQGAAFAVTGTTGMDSVLFNLQNGTISGSPAIKSYFEVVQLGSSVADANSSSLFIGTKINGPSFSRAGSGTTPSVTEATTLYVSGEPTFSGTHTVTNRYAMHTLNGVARFDGGSAINDSHILFELRCGKLGSDPGLNSFEGGRYWAAVNVVGFHPATDGTWFVPLYGPVASPVYAPGT